MADGLEAYRAKRDFQETPEPAGDTREPEVRRRFVVQEHSARAMHWDLRLEHEGTLASWAIPKGIPADPKRNNLAVRTEDHPLEYLDFHGEIPAGHYGAGTMRIFDRGTFELHKWRDAEVMLTFHGERVRGRYVLFRTGGKNWMIHRMGPPGGPDPAPRPRPAAPAGRGADARAGGADAGAHRQAAPARRPLGLRDQVGRRAGDRLRRGRAAAPGEPQRQQHHAALPRAARARARARHPRSDPRRRGGGARRA